MAIFHLSVKVVSRSTGRSVVAAAAYRAGTALTDERQGLTHDYSRRGDVRETMIFAPEEAPAWAHDRQALWTAVDAADKRKDARTAREIEVAFPRELTTSQQRDLLRTFVQEACVAHGMVADVAIHEGHHAHEPNPHAHILLTTRSIGPEGFGPKNRDWNAKDLLLAWRAQWEATCNAALAAAGHAIRIDARSLADQGLDRLPTVHEGPAVRQMEQRGQPTERGDWNRAIAEYNHIVIDLAAVRAERDRVQQEVAAQQERREAHRDQDRREAGWSAADVAAAHDLEARLGRPSIAKDWDAVLDGQWADLLDVRRDAEVARWMAVPSAYRQQQFEEQFAQHWHNFVDQSYTDLAHDADNTAQCVDALRGQVKDGTRAASTLAVYEGWRGWGAKRRDFRKGRHTTPEGYTETFKQWQNKQRQVIAAGEEAHAALPAAQQEADIAQAYWKGAQLQMPKERSKAWQRMDERIRQANQTVKTVRGTISTRTYVHLEQEAHQQHQPWAAPDRERAHAFSQQVAARTVDRRGKGAASGGSWLDILQAAFKGILKEDRQVIQQPQRTKTQDAELEL